MPLSLPRALLLVDGYNIIGVWSHLKKTRDRDGLEASRRLLIEALANYSALQDWDTQVVFDAQYRDTQSSRELVTQHLCVYYTDFGETADTYIERVCATGPRQTGRRQRTIVSTSDRALQLTAMGYGAEWMSPQHLRKSVETADRHRQLNQKSRPLGQSRFLFQSLDAKTQKRLANLRFELQPPKK